LAHPVHHTILLHHSLILHFTDLGLLHARDKFVLVAFVAVKARKALLTQKGTHNNVSCLNFESPVKQNQSPAGARRPAANYLVFYLYSPEGATCLAQPRPYRPEITNFFHPLSFSALIRGDPLRIYVKALLILKLVFQAADGEDLVILACTVFDRSIRVTDGQNCDG